MTHRIFRLAVSLSALSLAGLAVNAQNASPQSQAQAQFQQQGQIPAFTHPDSIAADLARLDMALNNTGTVSGRFLQSNLEGASAGGTLHMARPGKIRFEYDAPSRMLIASDGKTVVQTDVALGTSDRVPLSATPLNFFLKTDVNLARDADVVALQKLPGRTAVTLRDKSGKQAGQMTLVFNEPNLALTEWVVVDEFGKTVRVALSSLVYNQELDPRLFVLGNAREERRRRE